MNLFSLLTAIFLLVLSSASPSRAALFSFTFTPDLMFGDDVATAGYLETDDMPYVSNIVAVAGQARLSALSEDPLFIDGMAPDGLNILDQTSDVLAAYFSFSTAWDGIDYTFAFGPSAFSPYGLSVTGTDGSTWLAHGDLTIADAIVSEVPPPVSTVPLPASLPLFGAALVGLAGLGYSLKRRASVSA